MRWKIGQFEFCDSKQQLIDDGQVVQLEPMLAEVLGYFCRHPGEIISRDSLIEQVWRGRIVTDNAVNRVIAKLRKVLGDSSTQPKFILTLPKKGYRLIIEPVAMDNSPLPVVEQPATEPPSSRQRSYLWLFLPLFLLVLLGGIYIDLTPDAQVVQVEAITHEGGQEYFPAVSADGRYLAFSERRPTAMTLQLSDLQQQKTVRLSIESGWSGPADWSHDGSQLVYLHTDNTDCQYILVTLDGLQIKDQNVIYRCPAGSFGKMLFSHQPGKMLLAERANSDAPYLLYSLNSLTGDKQLLPQPTPVLAGNSQFDLHPKQDWLLISSPDGELQESFYKLDLNTGGLSLLFSLDAYVCCAVWDHNGQSIVMMSAPPSNQLLRFSLDGAKQQVVYSATHSIATPVRHPNGADYLYSGGQINRDIFIRGLANDSPLTTLADSSLDDSLPRLSQDGRYLAYVTLTGGKQQVWLVELASGQRRRLSHFDKPEFLTQMAWSADGRRLALATLNSLFVIEVASAKMHKLALPAARISAISFVDNSILAFSQQQQGHWQRFYYLFANQVVEPQDSQTWAKAYHARDSADNLWQDQQQRWFQGDEASIQPLPVSNIGQYRIKKVGNSLFYLTRTADEYQVIQYQLKSDQQQVLISSPDSAGIPDFDVVGQHLVLSLPQGHNVDIYRVKTRP
ncbi:winged helix-turn-helix domain-containing protein [Bowmanella denitrificans]|uniref:winged helix-turn-helix domain-containing protein n=1 Tax=Bowmanella denitrificans TaxID=366582 RepID=UPI000C9BB8DB|nr:winged helix-turn-helix domain-containing protein [Bowmanella denitrificans]